MLKFENVSKIYKYKTHAKTVLNNVSFELPEKGMVFIIGKSGSGKTTILNLLGGIDRPTGGSIYFGDKDLSSLSNKKMNNYRAHFVGFIFQDFLLFEKQTVKSNLLLTGQLLHKKYSDERIGEILEEVDLAGYENKKCNLLSSGEKQRVSIARSLIKDAKIILADEPTGALDSENGERVFNILKKISETRLVVVVSHDMESAEKYADYMIRVKDGAIIEEIGFTQENSSVSVSVKFGKNYGLKASDVIKTSLANIGRTWLRTSLNFVICLIGLIVFFVANVIATVDGPSRLVTALYENNMTSGRIEKKSEDSYHPCPRFTIDEINVMCNENPAMDFFKVSRDLGGVFGVIECSGLAEIPQKTVQTQNFLYGETPKDLNEYFVTETFAEKLLEQLAGREEITDMESLIGYEAYAGVDYHFTLCGIVENSDLPQFYVYFQDGFLTSISDFFEKQNIEGLCDYMYFRMSGAFKSDYEFFKKYHGDNLYHKTSSSYIIYTALSNHFYSEMATYLGMSNWFYGISLVMMAFVVLICFNIISMSIRNNQRENGIRRALGFGNYDLFKIYLFQTAFPFVFLIPATIALGHVIISAFNKLLLSKLLVSFGLFAISAANVVWLLVLCVGIVLISTLLPMIKLFRKQPVDIIKSSYLI